MKKTNIHIIKLLTILFVLMAGSYGFAQDKVPLKHSGITGMGQPKSAALPFYEDWSSGNFTANAWTFDPDNSHTNWRILSTWAMFYPTIQLNDYSYALVSKPLTAISTGPIYLQYNIRLAISNHESTIENMDV